MKHAETAVCDGCGLSRICREFPVKGAVLSTAAADVSLEMGAGVDQLRISIFEPSPTLRFVQRGPFREDIADRSIDRTGQETVSLLEAGYHFRGDPANEWKRAWRLRTFQLCPAPGDETHILGFGKAAPELAHRH